MPRRMMSNKGGLGIAFEEKNKLTKGTKEWCDTNENIFYGCSNDCKYCYAKQMAIRFGRITSEEEWAEMKLNKQAFNKNFKKRKGRIMFPTSHDITRESYQFCVEQLVKMFKAGNKVLITTKPDDKIIRGLCFSLQNYKHQFQFRFTITSVSNEVLQKWEKNAPSIESRLAALRFAYLHLFRTSVSIEPFLDANPIPVILKVEPFVNETIWIGCMTKNGRVINHPFYSRKNLDNIIRQINRLSDKVRNKIRLKDTISNMGYKIK